MSEQPKGLAIRFELVSKQVGEENGIPVFKDIEYIEKRIPGDRTNIVFKPLRDADKKEFAAQYQHWLATREDPKSGYPLKDWPPLVRSQVEQLAFHGVKTVEELANLSDSVCQSIGSGTLAVRQKAKDWLDRAKGAGPESALRAELDAKDNEIATLKRQFSELTALVRAKESGEAVPAPSPVAGELAALKAQMQELLAAKAAFVPPEATAETPKKRGRPKKSETVAEG